MEKEKKQDDKDPFKVVKHPLSTEKSVRLMESENKLIFVVNKDSSKQEVKEAIEKLFKVKVAKVNLQVTNKSAKKAYVKFTSDYLAIDIATDLGLI